MAIIVIYHSNCFDGFGAAWVARRKFGADAQYIPAKYGDTPPDIRGADHTYIVDFSYSRQILINLYTIANHNLTVLDHHQTAQANCEGLPFCIFDMNQSGAMLTWKHLFPNNDAPLLIKYIQDRDLWHFRMPNSRAIHAWLESHPKLFELWDILVSDMEQPLNYERCLTEGNAILRFQSQKVDEMAREAKMVDLGDGEIPAVNCPYNFGSLVGERLGQLFPESKYAAYYFDRKDGQQQWGLRSTGYDVSEVAKRFGGGGHKTASGFVKGKETR